MKNYLISGAITVVIVAIAFILFGGKNPIVAPPLGATSVQVTDGNCLIGPTGGHTCMTTQRMQSASSTACTIQSPNATSSLVHTQISDQNATSSETFWWTANSATRFASTTAIGGLYNIHGGKSGFVDGSTSPAAADARVFAPNTYVVMGVMGAIVGSKVVGAGDPTEAGWNPSASTCEATFIY